MVLNALLPRCLRARIALMPPLRTRSCIEAPIWGVWSPHFWIALVFLVPLCIPWPPVASWLPCYALSCDCQMPFAAMSSALPLEKLLLALGGVPIVVAGSLYFTPPFVTTKDRCCRICGGAPIQVYVYVPDVWSNVYVPCCSMYLLLTSVA